MEMVSETPIRCQTLCVLGSLNAPVRAQKLVLAEGATLIGDVRVTDAEIRGHLEGSLQARGTVSIHSTARVSGKVRALELRISRRATVADADIKRVALRVFEGLDPNSILESRYDDSGCVMSMTFSRRAVGHI